MASDSAVSSSRSQSSDDDVDRVSVHGARVPLEWLVTRHDPQRYPAQQLSTQSDIRTANRNLVWSRQRDQWIAASAAAVHLALFSFNLAFWGMEGMPPDRYNPSNLRLRLGVRPGRYGNMDGTTRIYYDNLDGGRPS